jgi:hypothetical protein
MGDCTVRAIKYVPGVDSTSGLVNRTRTEERILFWDPWGKHKWRGRAVGERLKDTTRRDWTKGLDLETRKIAEYAANYDRDRYVT